MHLRNLSEAGFAKYGQLIQPDPGNDDVFQIIVQDKEASGWQIAVARKTRDPITRLDRHPNTRESFEPLTGVTVLLVAKGDPEQIDAFLLDRPVCLFKNIWHATMSLTETSWLKITENTMVESYAHELPYPLGIGVIELQLTVEEIKIGRSLE